VFWQIFLLWGTVMRCVVEESVTVSVLYGGGELSATIVLREGVVSSVSFKVLRDEGVIDFSARGDLSGLESPVVDSVLDVLAAAVSTHAVKSYRYTVSSICREEESETGVESGGYGDEFIEEEVVLS